MKLFKFLPGILLALIACGQNPKNNNMPGQTKSTLRDTITIFENMSKEICYCTISTMKNKKPSTSYDSCNKAILSKYADLLKQLGFDSMQAEQKLSQGFIAKIYRNCPDLATLMMKEIDDENAKKLLFTGTIVSQKQLSNGEFEIVMMESKTINQRVFKSKSLLHDPSKDKDVLSYELTIEYEIKHNPNTDKDEYYIKTDAKMMIMSSQRAQDHK